MRNVGMRHAPPDVMRRLLAGEPVDLALVSFRTTPRFETSAPDLQWLTGRCSSASGSDTRWRW